jgi:hypothetical protein
MTLSRAQITTVKPFDVRTVLLAMYDEIDSLHQATGTTFVTPVNNTQGANYAPPSPPGISLTGANGTFTYQITPPSQSLNKAIFYEISFSAQSNFTSGVTTLPVSSSTQGSVAAPGTTANFRVRASYDQTNWSAYASAGAAVAAGKQTSAATENNIVLNQTNYASIDSVAVGSSANIRVYGAAGPGTQYSAVKGATGTVLPSATIIGVPLGTSKVVAYDGANYQVAGTLPEVLADNNTPTGAVSVVESGAVTEPTVALVLSSSGGHVIAWNVVSQGNGLTAPVTLNITTSTGSGATPGAQTIVAGKLISIAPGNPGSGYVTADTVTATGGTFSGSTGGGTVIGGNGGRLIFNDGTTG